MAPVIVQEQQQRVCKMMRWGLVPGWSKGPDPKFNMINARAETIDKKPAYRNAFQHKRCLVPCDGFYEWHAVQTGKQEAEKHKARQPYYIYKKDRSLLAMAGIWELWPALGDAANPDESETINSFSIITTNASSTMQQIHHRMPVILKDEDFDNWLTDRAGRPDELKSLLVPYQEDDLVMHPVSRAVNTPKNDSIELTEAVSL
jgi:putative SOS response-associated peptidase YedK